MDSNTANITQEQQNGHEVSRQNPPVDEAGIFYISGKIKIFDPETNEVYLEQRI